MGLPVVQQGCWWCSEAGQGCCRRPLGLAEGAPGAPHGVRGSPARLDRTGGSVDRVLVSLVAQSQVVELGRRQFGEVVVVERVVGDLLLD